MIKRMLSLSLAVVLMSALLISAVPMTAVATTGNTPNTKFLAAIEPPVLGSIPIANRAELQKIGNDREYPLSGKYHLTADIDLSDGAWVPIGSSYGSNYFSGTFDGQGYVIRGLTIREAHGSSLSFAYAGLFSSLPTGAIIKNTGLENVSINIDQSESHRIYVGGISGWGGNIINCYVTGTISITTYYSGNANRYVYAGGITGYNGDNGTIYFFGYGEIPTHSISNCYSMASVSSSVNLESSFAYHRDVHSYAGGISGYSGADSSVENCYSLSPVTANYWASQNGDRHASYAGGISGYAESNAMTRNSYWNIDNNQTINGVALSNADKKGLGDGIGQVTALTTAQMQSQSSFSGWDFNSTWAIIPGVNKGYPVLRAFHEFPSSWAEQQINQAIAAGLVPSSLQSKYTQATTRAEFAALAVRLYENATGSVIETGRNPFTDTSDTNAVKAAAIGVTTGTTATTFTPNTNLTREQAAVMLTRLSDALGKPFPVQASTFNDNSSVASWAIEQVGRVQAAGIMGGTGNNMFSPQGPYTREQSIATIWRMYEFVR